MACKRKYISFPSPPIKIHFAFHWKFSSLIKLLSNGIWIKIVVTPLINDNGQIKRAKVRLGSKINDNGNNRPTAGEISNNRAFEMIILCS